jgi:hypothetical protein
MYGDCSQSELLGLCDRLGFRGTVRAHWVQIFMRAAHDDRASKKDPRQRRDLDFFIAEARKG